MKKYQDPELLEKLYWREGLSINQVAKKLKVSHSVIFYWMKRLGIPRRHRRPDITKSLLEELYIKKKLSMYKIADLLDTTYPTIWKKLKKFDIKSRTISEANTEYPKPLFSNDLIEKAYILGLRTGDISAKKNGRQIMVYTSTTHSAQFKMFKDAFEKYTHRIYVYIGTTPKGNKAWKISCNLHESFDFLENKPNQIPKWIIENDAVFYSFLSGYSDCEGNWDIQKQTESKKIRIRFRISSGDKIVLYQIKHKLESLNFKARFYLVRKASEYDYNKDLYCLELNYKEDVVNISKILLKFSKHLEKIWKMQFILKNSDKNWFDVKDEIEEFKKQIKQTLLDGKFSMLQLPCHQSATTNEGGCSQ